MDPWASPRKGGWGKASAASMPQRFVTGASLRSAPATHCNLLPLRGGAWRQLRSKAEPWNEKKYGENTLTANRNPLEKRADRAPCQLLRGPGLVC